MRPEAVPFVVIALLLAASGGTGTASVVMDGDRVVTDHEGALVVAGGSVTIPSDATVAGPVYVADGDLTVAGTVAGDVVSLSGRLHVLDGGGVTGVLENYGGSVTVDPGAAVSSRTEIPVAPERTPGSSLGFAVVEALGAAVLGYLLARRYPRFLANVGRAATEHPVVASTVGGLVGVTALAVAVFMAFTLVLLPVAILGVLATALVAAYGVVSLGYALGARVDRLSTPLATALGAVAVVAAMRLLTLVPVVGALGSLTVLSLGFGAALVTYLGTTRFEPAEIPAVE